MSELVFTHAVLVWDDNEPLLLYSIYDDLQERVKFLNLTKYAVKTSKCYSC